MKEEIPDIIWDREEKVKKDIEPFSFNQYAQNLGVVFYENRIRVPVNLDKDIFALLTLHYGERDNISKNSKLFSELFLQALENCSEIEEYKKATRTFKEILDNIY
jgi:hypothetical protein